MPADRQHPARLLRERARMTQVQLAKESGLTRAAVASLEEGRVRTPSPALLKVLSDRTSVPIARIEEQIREHLDEPPLLSPRARNVIALPAAFVQQYASFEAWMKEIAPSTTAFASTLRVPRENVARYLASPTRRIPAAVESALVTRLGASLEYVQALESLPKKAPQ